jgi:hypothetical protein
MTPASGPHAPAGTRVRLLWLVPVVLTAHNLEEALTIAPVLPVASARISGLLGVALPAVTYPQFLVVLAVVTAVPYFLAALGDLRRPASTAGYALLVVQATVLVNVASHVGAAITLGGYVPGLATALLVNLPFSLYLLSRAWTHRSHSRAALLGLAPLSLALHGPVLVGLLALAGWLLRR